MFKWVPISSGVNSAVNYHRIQKIKLTTLLKIDCYCFFHSLGSTRFFKVARAKCRYVEIAL